MGGSSRGDDSAGTSPGGDRASRLAAAAVGLHVLLALILYEPILFPGGDNAEYMILGESLRTGQGYHDLHLPGAPLHTKYPPGYPALLALLGLVGGLQLFKLASLAFTAGVVWLTWRLGRREFPEGVALAAAVAVAVSPVLLEYAHWELSEALFTLLVLAGCTAGGSERRAVRTAAVGPGVLAFLTRTAGLPLLVALALHPALRRRWREAAWAAAWGAAALAFWVLVQRLGPAGQPGYVEEWLLRDPYVPEAGRIGLAALVARVASNAWLYTAHVVPASLGVGSGVWTGVVHPFVLLAGAAAVALAFIGWLGEAGRRLRLTGLFMALYVALIAAWPSVWTDRRFLLPVLPLLLLYLVSGATAVADWVRRRSVPWMPAAAAGILVLAGLLVAGRLAPERLRCLSAWRHGAPCDLPQMASFYDAGRWAGDHTPAEAVIANRKPGLFFLFARRRGDVYRFSNEPALVFRSLEEMGADYVVVDAISLTTDRYLMPAVEAYRHRFLPIYSEGEPPTFLLRLLPEERTAAGRRPPRLRPEPDGT